jgi:hypothetical protein
LFSKVKHVTPLKELQYNRPNDKTLEEFQQYAKQYFDMLGQICPALGEYFSSSHPAKVIEKHRTTKGGNILFRPVGQTLFVNMAAELVKQRGSFDEAMELLRLLPQDLSKHPYVNLIWDPNTSTLDLRRQALVRRLLLYMLGTTKSPRQVQKLKDDLARVYGVDAGEITLPKKVIA